MLTKRMPSGSMRHSNKRSAFAQPGHSSAGHRNAQPHNGTSKRKKRLRFYLSCGFIGAVLVLVNLVGFHRISKHTINDNSLYTDSRFNAPSSYNTTHIVDSSPIHVHSSASNNQRIPTNHACDGYKGIYHVEKGDAGGAAGTIFFQFVIGQIIWAEKYNFKPWVHLNDLSYVIYDPMVHGQGPGVTFQMMDGLEIATIRRENGHWRDVHPGKPINFDRLVPKTFHFNGTGAWEEYFEPVSDFVPGDTSCINKPLVTMSLKQVTPGVHGFSPWAPRCWRYEYLPDYVTKPHIPLQQWLEPQRKIAHDVLVRYIRFVPFIKKQAERLNPDCSLAKSCLGVHIRQSDKANGRRQIQTDEFLPFVQAFVEAGGQWIYLATDSEKVINYINEHWPKHIQEKIRSMGSNVVRSSDHQAVFDIAEHHRTNTEILIEILALSKCQFMVHGLSAVTESSIWINLDLHYTSVNLEDPDHLVPQEFRSLVGQVLNGGSAEDIQLQQRPRDWWKVERSSSGNISSRGACNDFNGILLISNVGEDMAAGPAFFNSVLNQLYYAERYNLKPWVHLGHDSDYIYDEEVHGLGEGISIEGMVGGIAVKNETNGYKTSYFYPGEPIMDGSMSSSTLQLSGNGIWTDYFDQVSDFVPGDSSCAGKPIVSLDSHMVRPGLYSWSPWSIKAWRNDDIPDDLWKPNGTSLSSWVEPMRRKAHNLVKKYIRFRPHLERRALEVNPVNETSSPCMAIHLRNSDKGKNKYRSKFPVTKFRDYINAFLRAGGKHIYVATDSHRVLEYIREHFPNQIQDAIRTQGQYVVRSSFDWPIHRLESHHRTNSEVLVDILAMSKCSLLLHGHSTVSEAAIYLNLDLHNHSMNWEDPNHMSVESFEQLSREVLGTQNLTTVALEKDVTLTKHNSQMDQPLGNLVLKGNQLRQCRKNAIVYLAQKRHSTYDRDSYGILLDSLALVHKNYLSLNTNKENTDVLIFHTADFDGEDLELLREKFGSDFLDLVTFVDLNGTKYWRRPSWHENDNPFQWYAYPLFSEGYRRMMHWFAIDIWRFFQDYGDETGCRYEFIMRFDEDSFLHSPIKYDIFDFMRTNDYHYGFRLCSYEMQVTQRIWKLWRQSKGSPTPVREVELEMCGVYNNFFVANISFFQSKQVQKFLHFVDRQGMIYRRRLGDLMVHSMAIYAFSPPERIHRFLDFTYEHATVDKKTGCVMWGGIQAGYDDPNADATIDEFVTEKVYAKGCQANLTLMGTSSLSPTYAHLPTRLNGKVALRTAMAGRVELPGRGVLSG